MKSKKTTIYDIAKELNTTAATVSRALRNSTEVGAAMSKLVQETAVKMNYKQNKLAASLRSGKSNNVGVIVPRIDTNFFGSIIRGIEEELQPEGYQVIICQTQEDENREMDNINTLLNAQVDGILMSISDVSKENNEHIQRIVEKKIPLIFFDRKKNMNGVSSVTIDDFQGAYQVTEHLINQGCTRIAYLSGDQSLEIYEKRYNGYLQALKDNKIDFVEEYVMPVKSNVDAGKEATNILLKLETPPNAIFSTSDFAALGAIQTLKKRGIKIPEDFCVFGFGNEPFTKYMELTISSVDQSPRKMGRTAAKVFLEKINNKELLNVEKKVVLAAELHIRKSSTRIVLE